MIVTKYVLHAVITPVQFDIDDEEGETLLSKAVNPPELGYVIGICDNMEEAEESRENLFL